MLRPITTKALEKLNNKLWFNDHDNDLFIWLDKQDNIVSFQFCYNKSINEHAINWHQQKGFDHSRVDTGEAAGGLCKMTPIMVPDGIFNFKEIALLFRTISQHNIDDQVADFIFNKILSYAD
jgi:hypothetical protein